MRDKSKKNRSNWNWWKNILVYVPTFFQSIEDTEKFYFCLLGGIDEIAIVVASYRRPSYGSFVPTLVFVTSLVLCSHSEHKINN